VPTPIIPKEIHLLEKGKVYGELADRIANEPKPAQMMAPECPDHLTELEKTQWEYFSNILDNYGLFTTANATHLEMLAVNMVEWRRVVRKLAKEGWVMTLRGNVMANPLVGIKNKLEEHIRANLMQLGLGSQGLAKLGALASKARKRDEEVLLD